jgi:hypothetical protein
VLNEFQAIEHWNTAHDLHDCPDQGLINRTWLVGTPTRHVLQWVNPIFDPRIHEDLVQVGAHLLRKGILSPRLIPLPSGEPCLRDEKGTWRVWEFIQGRTFHSIGSLELAEAAGAQTGRFHRALSDLEHRFTAPSRDVHNTPKRMEDLADALEGADSHPLCGAARELGGRVLAAWSDWEGEIDLPKRICHGDLKISNIRFHGTRPEALCLIDLDTVGPQTLSAEMGDAWRSWCNPAGEENPADIRFDTDIFEASARGWLGEAPVLSAAEESSLVPGIERICLELSARFCADAVQNSYFKEDRTRYQQAGSHNLLKAQGQFALAESARAQRERCEQIVAQARKESR